MTPRRVVLLKDLVIPAGTIFENVDGHKRAFISGNYEATIGLTKDTSGSVLYGVELADVACAEWFAVQE